MNRFSKSIFLITAVLVAILIFGLTGCGTTSTPTATPTPTTTPTITPAPVVTPTPTLTPTLTPTPLASPTPTAIPTTPVVLTVNNGSQTKTFSLAQLQAMKVTTAYGAQKTKTGNITGPYSYKGILLTDVLNAVGSITQSNSVKVTASDNYSKTFTYAQLTQPTFNVYDLSGNQATPELAPTLFIAWSQDGNAFATGVGPLELGIVTSKNQATDSSNWIKMTMQIDVISAQ